MFHVSACGRCTPGITQGVRQRDAGRGNLETMIFFRSLITGHRSQITDHWLQITDHELRTENF